MTVQEWVREGKPKNVILLGDCMDLMEKLGNKEIDIAIVDPPYGVGADKANSTGKKKSKRSSATIVTFYGNQRWDTPPSKEYFEELKRVSKNQIIWGVNYYDYPLPGGRIYWHKNVTVPTFSSGELAYCSFMKRIQYIEYTWNGMLQEDMKCKQKRIHPTEKPIALYRMLLQDYAKKGDVILDTHSGSGALAIACHLEGYEFIAIEKDEEYWRRSVQRYNDIAGQKLLFA